MSDPMSSPLHAPSEEDLSRLYFIVQEEAQALEQSAKRFAALQDNIIAATRGAIKQAGNDASEIIKSGLKESTQPIVDSLISASTELGRSASEAQGLLRYTRLSTFALVFVVGILIGGGSVFMFMWSRLETQLDSLAVSEENTQKSEAQIIYFLNQSQQQPVSPRRSR